MRDVTQKRRARRSGAIAAAAVILLAGSALVLQRRHSRPSTPTTRVQHGEFIESIPIRGRIKALQSVAVYAPMRAGDVQIIKILPSGASVKRGEVVVQFDTAKVRRSLEEHQAELKEADAEIAQARAQGRITAEQDQTALLKASYDVERARLEASKQEILSAIDGAENRLKVSDAEAALKQTQAQATSDRQSADSDVLDNQQKRAKALMDLQEARRQMASLTLRAPSDGILTVMPNYRAGGFFSDSAPAFKAGDRAWPGATLAELPDLSRVAVRARIDEADRGRLRLGQPAIVTADALPGRQLKGHLHFISPLAQIDFSGWPPVMNFDVLVDLDQSDPNLRPGMSAMARVQIDRVADAVWIPPQAAFSENGETVAYVLRGSAFERRVIVTGRRNETQLQVLRGLQPGETVALQNPQAGKKPAGGV